MSTDRDTPDDRELERRVNSAFPEAWLALRNYQPRCSKRCNCRMSLEWRAMLLAILRYFDEISGRRSSSSLEGTTAAADVANGEREACLRVMAMGEKIGWHVIEAKLWACDNNRPVIVTEPIAELSPSDPTESAVIDAHHLNDEDGS